MEHLIAASLKPFVFTFQQVYCFSYQVEVELLVTLELISCLLWSSYLIFPYQQLVLTSSSTHLESSAFL
jgi:hypothetical protein